MTAPSGLVDLEKELTCSICTEILYQPLTLLDCLHTFCGSCLKEWFGWQKQNADKEYQRHHHGRSRRKQYAFTCPSCRAIVRETRPNATVTTLLDMFLKANPEKDKPAAEKAEIAAQYTHGDSVLPKVEATLVAGRTEDAGGEDHEEEEDRRLLEHVREMSLQTAGAPGPQSERTRERRREQPRSPPASRSSHDETQRRTAAALATSQRLSQSGRATQLGHQSSLRSLLSNTYDSDEMKEEILRQIAEEGLLDDIDWDNIQDEQEDEISERIAEAYRRRRRDRTRRPQTAQRDGTTSRDVSSSRDSRRSGEGQRPPRRTADPTNGQGRPPNSRPPASRPHLLENASESRPRSRHRHQRSSSQGRELQAPSDARPAARSATDLSENPTSRDGRHERHRRASHGQRSSTDPNSVSISEQWRRPRAAPGQATPSQVDTSPNSSTTQQVVQSPRAQEQRDSESPPAGPQFITVACDRCGKANIETSLHYSCPDCRPDGSTYDLCLHCYRMGKGCLHWFGFGHAAWQRFERMGSPGGQAPHVLRSQKYVDAHDSTQAEQIRHDLGVQQLPQGNLLLQKGVFCDVCHENANACYWHCDVCNEGEWGYCNRCVSQARHCTHPLLPLALQTSSSSSSPLEEPATHLHPLKLPCTCNVCAAAIPPEAHRLHCPDCDEGDYDVCMPCYRSLVNSGRIKAADGLHGWRRCPAGHRTLVIDFADRWRRVLDEVVGGWALEGAGSGLWSWREGADGQRAFKNDGRGAGGSSADAPPPALTARKGARCMALWAWVPEEGVTDELAFPRGAVVSEVVDINGDFLWGVYCRGGGLFPAGYVRALD